jgi:hypothetical protein
VEKAAQTLAIVMEQRPVRSRWAEVAWQPVSVLESDEVPGPARLLVRQEGYEQWLHPGFALAIHRDEIEGYYLNVSSVSPRVFVMWRMDGERGLPLELTASYEEGARWLDGGALVEALPMPPAVFAWVGGYVERNYRPEPRKRIKPRSFVHPKDRAG